MEPSHHHEEPVFDFDVEPTDAVFVERHFLGKTRRDREIEELEIPIRPLWLRYVILSLRYYQRRISGKLGNRCVFDPSCSHYSEVAFREKGFITGGILTIKRLIRCRARNGGLDELT